MVDSNETPDGWGDVKESEDAGGGESDNVTGPHSVTVLDSRKKVFIAFVGTANTTASTAAEEPAVRKPWPHTIK